MPASSSTQPDGEDSPSSPPLPPKRNRDPQLRLPRFTSIGQDSRRNNSRARIANEDADDEGESSDDDDAAAFFAAASSAPQTPNIAEAASQLRRSLSVHGLSELSAMPPHKLRKSVGDKVWRPQDDAVRLPGDFERLAVHVFRGGTRAFNLAFGLRGTLMLVLELVKGLRKRKLKGKDLYQAIFSLTNLRFGIMFGLWAALYKTVHNSLRLLSSPPMKRPSRSQSQPASLSISVDEAHHSGQTSADELRTSGTTTPRSGYDELQGKTEEEKSRVKSKQKKRAFMKDPRSKVWHAYVAGAVSALAVMVETKDNRISLAQQLFVRGLEGTYNVAHHRGYVNIPHGAVIAFGLACGQIMWAWLNAPETLPRGYVSWITNASMVTPKATAAHLQMIHNQPMDTNQLMEYFLPKGQRPPQSIGKTSAGLLKYPAMPPWSGNRRGMTGRNTTLFMNWLEGINKGNPGPYVPCHIVHPWEDSHWWGPLDRFVEVTRWILPVYLTLHFVPAVFLRTGSFLKDPVRVFLRSLFGSVRSSSFLGFFVIIFQTVFCFAHSLHSRISESPYLLSITPKWFMEFLRGGGLHWFAGFLTSASLFVDHSRRRAELAAYVLPKGMESAWSVARKRGWAPFVPGGDLLLTSAGMSLVMGTYARSPEHLSGLVRRVIYQFIGRN